MQQSPEKKGTLYIVPTPIGNLEDITLRALRILKEVSFVFAEDTRHSQKLLNHFGIKTRLRACYREKEEQRSQQIVELLLAGNDIGLMSDAGTPAISDPGAIAVAKAHAQGIQVVPLPGPCAAVTALSGSGITDPGFTFIGFAPAKKSRRMKLLQELVNHKYPLIFYESPRRIHAFLSDAVEILGNRKALWARELTKSYEELVQEDLLTLLEKAETTPRGEFVLIIHPGQTKQIDASTIDELIVWYRDNTDLSLKDASRTIADDMNVSKSKVYQTALSYWNKPNHENEKK